MRKCLISPTSDWVMHSRTFCRRPTKKTPSYFSVAITWALLWPPRDTSISASTGASETRILKFWTVARALLWMGKIQMHCRRNQTSAHCLFQKLPDVQIWQILRNDENVLFTSVWCPDLTITYLVYIPVTISRGTLELLAEPGAVCLFDSLSGAWDCRQLLMTSS